MMSMTPTAGPADGADGGQRRNEEGQDEQHQQEGRPRGLAVVRRRGRIDVVLAHLLALVVFVVRRPQQLLDIGGGHPPHGRGGCRGVQMAEARLPRSHVDRREKLGEEAWYQ